MTPPANQKRRDIGSVPGFCHSSSEYGSIDVCAQVQGVRYHVVEDGDGRLVVREIGAAGKERQGKARKGKETWPKKVNHVASPATTQPITITRRPQTRQGTNSRKQR
jgi:hypothetical protein